MKNRDLYFAVSEIDDGLVLEAMEESVLKKKTKSKKIWFSALSAAAVFALVLSLSSFGRSFTLKPAVVTTDKATQTKETQKADKETTLVYEQTKPTPVRPTESETHNNTTVAPTRSETTIAPTRSETTVAVSQRETTDSVTDKPTEITTQKTPVQSYASCSFNYWKSAPDVVWGEDAVKGNARNQEIIPLGSIKITEPLRKLMQSGDDSTIYAVQVGFSSCAEKEFENWEFDGTTFAKLKKGYNKAEMTDEEIANYKTKVWEMKYAFCNQKINTFKDTFSKAGLKIYVIERNITDCFFYVFGTKKQIEGINPKGTEAFVLYAADQMK